MKTLRCWNGRSQEYEQLQQSIKNLESSVAALASEVAMARSAAASADQSRRTLVNRLDELEDEENRAIRPWRVLRLVALCVSLLLLAGVFTYTGVKGFANPLAASSDVDSVSLAVRVPTPTAKQLGLFGWTPITTFIVATFDPNIDYASYSIGVPAKYAGAQFALVLEGTARIDQPYNLNLPLGAPTAVTSLRSRLSPCAALTHWPGPDTNQCQLITGRLPSKANDILPAADANNCNPGQSPLPQKGTSAVAIEIQGTPQLRTGSDWAYQRYSLPGLGDSGPLGYVDGIGHAKLDSSPLDGWYEYAEISGCRQATLPDNADLTNIETPASESIGNRLIWNGPDIYDTAFVMRRPDADEIGNALLAAGAAMAALAIGFVPVTYDANRERRRVRKRQRARQKVHPV